MNSDQKTSIGLTLGLYNAWEAEFETGGMRGLYGRSRVRPPKVKAQINNRHILSSDAVAKAGKTQDVTLASKSALDADLEAYNAGNFAKTKEGNIDINGNIYGIKNEGKTLYPIKGNGFINLTAGQVQAIQFYKTKTGSDLTRALDGAKVTQADRTFAESFIKEY